MATDLAYAGTSGHAGTTTSKARALNTDASGKTKTNQDRALSMLRVKKGKGITVKEFRENADLHHGTASGTLTNLHKVGRITRLAEDREGCKVYVLPEWTRDRATEEAGNTSIAALRGLLTKMTDYLYFDNSQHAKVLVAEAEKLGL